jgi:Protein of unknown function (DUF2800)
MNAPLVEQAHSPFGGSGAPRVIRCPASVQAIEKVPAYLRKVSSYAMRGTALHLVMALLIEQKRRIDDFAGETIDGYTITSDDVENALRPVLAYVEALLDTPGAEYFLEHRVIFPTIAGAFGTLDLIIRIGRIIYIIDFKFGSGIRVLALYPDGDEDVINAQLLFYAAAARHSNPEFFVGVDNIVLTILQPMSIEPDAEMVSSVPVGHAELDAFVVAYCGVCKEALSEAPRLERGPHCRFCAARPICRLHTGPLLDLAQFKVPAPLPLGGALVAPAEKAAYLQLLAEGLNLVDAVKDISTALRDQAKRALENGDLLPGYALSAGRAERRWGDESTAIAALKRLGFRRDDIIAEAMRSPKQIEIRAKARGLKVPQELIVSQRSGVSLVRSENAHDPIPGRAETMRDFVRALDVLRKGETDD